MRCLARRGLIEGWLPEAGIPNGHCRDRKRRDLGGFAAVIIGRAREDVTRFGHGTAGAI
jgi:hypothetical protein